MRDAIGAIGARFGDLIGVVHEILAQRRQRTPPPAPRAGMIETALERRRVGENGKTGRAAGLIGPGERNRIEIGANESLGGARLLHFGDQRIVARGEPVLDRFGEAARRALGLRVLFERRQRAIAFGGGDFLALIGGDLFQNVSHRWKPRSGGRAGLRPRQNPPIARQDRGRRRGFWPCRRPPEPRRR